MIEASEYRSSRTLGSVEQIYRDTRYARNKSSYIITFKNIVCSLKEIFFIKLSFIYLLIDLNLTKSLDSLLYAYFSAQTSLREFALLLLIYFILEVI